MSILTLKAFTEKAEAKKTIFWYSLSKNIELNHKTLTSVQKFVAFIVTLPFLAVFFLYEDQKKKQPSLILRFPVIISFLHKMNQ